MTNRIVEFEARFQKRRADALEREMKRQAFVRPTPSRPQQGPVGRSDEEKREPAFAGRAAVAE